MAIEKFIPEVWAKEFEKELEKDLVFYENTNHKYEGLAKRPGDSIKILGIGRPTLQHYSDGKLHQITNVEAIQDLSQTMPIQQIEQFAFYVDDLEKRQAEGGSGLLGEYMREAKTAVAEAQDAFIAGLVTDKAVKKYTPDAAITTSNILTEIDKVLVMLLNNNVKRNDTLTLTAPPWFINVLKQAYVDLDTNNSEMLKNGRVGRYNGITIKESTQVYNDGTHDHIQIKTNRAIAFVKPYLHLESFKPDDYFWDAVKGYSLYDGKVVRPKEIIDFVVTGA